MPHYKSGISGAPGKFEGEPEYVEYFYDLSMEGSDDIYIAPDGEQIDAFDIGADDKREFPSLQNYGRIIIWEDTNGFVYHKLFEGFWEMENYLHNIGVAVY